TCRTSSPSPPTWPVFPGSRCRAASAPRACPLACNSWGRPSRSPKYSGQPMPLSRLPTSTAASRRFSAVMAARGTGFSVTGRRAWILSLKTRKTENRKPSLPEARNSEPLFEVLGRDEDPGCQAVSPGRGHKILIVLDIQDPSRRQPGLPEQGLKDRRLGLAAAHPVGEDQAPEMLEQRGEALPDVTEVQGIGVGEQIEGV